MLGIMGSTGVDSFRHLSLHRHQQQERQSTEVGKQAPQANQRSETLRDSPNEFTSKEEKEILELQKRDREVRQHEQAHKAAAGSYAIGGPHYEFRRGPDGKSYAVGGEVQIDTSPVPDDPEATIRKAKVIRQAALAPKDPSSQDRSVAAQANAMERQARVELQEKPRKEGEPNPPSSQVNSQSPNMPEFARSGTLINLLA